MQHVFGHLAHSHRRSYNPVVLVEACSDAPPGFFALDSPVREQNDANEFFNVLVDRCGDCFPVDLPSASGASVEGPKEEDGVGSSADVGVPETKDAGSAQGGKAQDCITAAMQGSLVHQLIGPCLHYGCFCCSRLPRASVALVCLLRPACRWGLCARGSLPESGGE
jgi:hypothetical protein